MQSAVNALAFPVPDKAWSVALLRRRSDLVLLRTASGETTACVHVHSKAKRRRRMTILYSHANAEDLGLALPFVEALARYAGADVLAYEYLGYSLASGDPSEQGCIECIDAAHAYLTMDCGIDPKQIIAYGRSIGSGPTVDLCARHQVGGMILQSPIASAGLVVMPSFAARALSTFDLFRNYEKISSVTCRSLLMHGRDDQMVPFAHSHDVLYPLLVDPHAPVWLEGCGHHDMPDDACLRAVSDFVGFVGDRSVGVEARRVDDGGWPLVASLFS